MTQRVNSPAEQFVACKRPPCAVQVGRPVAGPGRCASTNTVGFSIMAFRDSVSLIRSNPTPEVAVSARGPMYIAPAHDLSGGDFVFRLLDHHVSLVFELGNE